MTLAQFAIARQAAQEARAVLAREPFPEQRKAAVLALFEDVQAMWDGEADLSRIRRAAKRLRNGAGA